LVSGTKNVLNREFVELSDKAAGLLEERLKIGAADAILPSHLANHQLRVADDLQRAISMGNCIFQRREKRRSG